VYQPVVFVYAELTLTHNMRPHRDGTAVIHLLCGVV
jgi:hypothetical protein